MVKWSSTILKCMAFGLNSSLFNLKAWKASYLFLSGIWTLGGRWWLKERYALCWAFCCISPTLPATGHLLTWVSALFLNKLFKYLIWFEWSSTGESLVSCVEPRCWPAASWDSCPPFLSTGVVRPLSAIFAKCSPAQERIFVPIGFHQERWPRARAAWTNKFLIMKILW